MHWFNLADVPDSQALRLGSAVHISKSRATLHHPCCGVSVDAVGCEQENLLNAEHFCNVACQAKLNKLHPCVAIFDTRSESYNVCASTVSVHSLESPNH